MGAQHMRPPKPGWLRASEGFIDVEGGRVWYRIVGAGNATPLLVIDTDLLDAEEAAAAIHEALARPGDPA